MLKIRSIAVGILLLSAVALLASSPVIAAEGDLPLANGEHWVAAPEKSKMAYLVGVANFLELEHAMQGENPSQEMQGKTLVQNFVKGLSNYSIEQVVQGIDAWYAENPDQLKRPVLDLIYFKMVIPNL